MDGQIRMFSDAAQENGLCFGAIRRFCKPEATTDALEAKRSVKARYEGTEEVKKELRLKLVEDWYAQELHHPGVHYLHSNYVHHKALPTRSHNVPSEVSVRRDAIQQHSSPGPHSSLPPIIRQHPRRRFSVTPHTSRLFYEVCMQHRQQLFSGSTVHEL